MMLYKYYSPQPYNFCAVCNGELWFATTKLLNDPYDLYSGQSVLAIPLGKYKSLRNYIFAYLNNKKRSSLFCHVMATFSSCSFSLNLIDRLMWAHYADAYKGFCVGFEVNEKSNECFHKVIYTDQMPLYPDKLRYVPDFKEYMNEILNEWSEECDEEKPIELEMLKGYTTPQIKRFVNHLLCVKAQEWCYEQEMRLLIQIDYKKEGELIKWSDYITPKEIIIGSRFDSCNYLLMEKIAKKHGLSLNNLELNEKRYFALNINKIL